MEYICKVRPTPRLLDFIRGDSRYRFHGGLDCAWIIPTHMNSTRFAMLFASSEYAEVLETVPEMTEEELLIALTT